MKTVDLKTYWKKAAINNKAIAHVDDTSIHFICYSAEAALASLKDIEDPVLALELPEMRLSDALSDNVRLNSNGAVLILKGAAQGNSSEIEQVMLETEIIAFELLTKMMNDRRKANDVGFTAPEKYMKHLDLNKVRLVDVGPVFNSKYGWRVEFDFNGPVNLTLDESKWTNETKWTI